MDSLTDEQRWRDGGTLGRRHERPRGRAITGHRRETVILYGRLAGAVPPRNVSKTVGSLAA